ncbi:MAG: hypothetical protein R3199_03640 [Gemmatimonadota bacterium]|nr:hypothetical protein [Gemmatimonadota bacterium]
MTSDLTPTPGRATVAGAVVLMACACGVAVQSAKAVALTGVAATTTIVHPILLAGGAALLLLGLARKAPRAAALAAAGLVVLAAAAALTPPRVMTSSALPWSGTQLAGAGLYVLAAAILGLAIFRAFPTPKPDAAAMGIGGAALATGCSCCMVNGAISGTLGTAGTGSGFVHPGTALFWVGMALIAAGAWRLAGWRAAAWVPLGAIVIRFGSSALPGTGDWEVGGIALRTFAGYGITLLGTAIVLGALGLAWRLSREPAVEPVPADPALGTTG